MKYVTLNNGVKMPLEGFGVFQIPDLQICENAVCDAIKSGYRLIDTAAAYMNEESVGKAIAKSGVPREELFIVTKLWVQDMSYEKAKKAFNTSMEKLGLDYLDLYLIHQPMGDYHGAWRAMEENGVTPMAWGPLAEGKHEIFTHKVLSEIGDKYHKTAAQIALKWNVQRGVVIIPKSTHINRMEQNMDIWNFGLSDEEMQEISKLDLGKSEIVDHSDPAFIKMIHSMKIYD